MATSNNLRWLSLVMAWGATLGAIWVPVLLPITILFPANYPFVGNVSASLPQLAAHVPLLYRAASFGLSLIPTFFDIWAWWSLRRLFLLYANGEVFSIAALRQINNIALALLGSAIATVIVQPLSGIVLDWPNVVAHRPFSFSFAFGSDNFADLFKAAVVYVIALVMADARRIADENKAFV